MSKNALITGASGAIGSAISRKLAEEGYSLRLLGFHNTDHLNNLAEELRNIYDIPVSCCTGDICDSDFIARCFSDLDLLDLLVNAAGIAHFALLQDMTDTDWKHIMDINLNSCFYTCRLAIPLMLHAGSGRIINISSVWGNTGASLEAAYSASKGALNAFSKALGKELAPSRIAVNALALGYIDTPMNNHLSDEEKRAIYAEIPADRPGTPDEAAAMVALLAQAPLYLTAQVITMDGGWT